MSGVIIGAPVTLSDANIEALSVPENDYPVWDPDETYDLDEYVIVTGTDIHQIWRSVVNSNVGNNPLDEVDLDSPSKWALDGPTNAYKMFDQYISTITTAAGSISFTLKAMGMINVIGFFGLTGDTITITVREEDGTFISTETRDLVSYSTFNSEWDTFFTPFLSIDFMVFKDLIPNFNGRYEIIVSGTQCGIGAVVPSYAYEFNQMTRDSSNTPKSYAVKIEKTPGIFDFTDAPSALESELGFGFEDRMIDVLNRLIKQRLNKPTLVIGSDQYECFTHYGNIYECPNSLPYANEGTARLKVESLF